MFDQHPLVPLIFSAISIFLIIKQCFVKHRFLKGKLLFTFLITFVLVFFVCFYNDIKNGTFWLSFINVTALNWILFVIDIIVGIILFTFIDTGYASQKFQYELTKTINETKYYAVLDKKDRIKEISALFLTDLELELTDIYGKNFFDILEKKYRIIGFNGQEAYKKDIKKYYEKYEKRVTPENKSTIELELQDDDANDYALYFHESVIFQGEKYKGRILMGEKKNEESLIGMEKDLASASSELEIIKNRFVTILEKTTEGIYFNDLSQGYIWCNDTLVKKLSLNGNSLSNSEFYNMIHPEDVTYYKEKMKNISNDYNISYRFNTGSSYIYVKEEGRKIVVGKQIELCGVMTVIDNYKFAKTDTILDSIEGEPELLAKISMLEKTDKIYEVVYFRVASIPEINDKFGRAIGNTMLAQYVNLFKQNFVNDNLIYRVSGLDFVAIVTDYRKMDMLKNNLVNGEKILHINAEYVNQKVEAEIFMGIARNDDVPSRKDTLKNSKEALRFCTNPQFNSNFAFFKDIR